MFSNFDNDIDKLFKEVDDIQNSQSSTSKVVEEQEPTDLSSI